MKNLVHERAYRGKMLDKTQERENQVKSGIWVVVNYVFGMITNSMKKITVREHKAGALVFQYWVTEFTLYHKVVCIFEASESMCMGQCAHSLK